MPDEIRERIGLRLKDAREYLCISQEEVAKILGISRSAISLIESGQRKLDSVELMDLAKLYKRPMAYFTSEDFSVPLDTDAEVLARSFSGLSQTDKEELRRFAEFLAMKSDGK